MFKDDLAYIDHILDCIRKINEFSHGLSLKEFKTNELVSVHNVPQFFSNRQIF